MVDVEKELGSLFEKLDQEQKTKEEEYQKTDQKMKIEYDEFKDIDDRIAPVMLEYQKVPSKKGHRLRYSKRYQNLVHHVFVGQVYLLF